MTEPNYGILTSADYADKINSPAQSPEYFKLFHAPLIEEAKTKSPNGKSPYSMLPVDTVMN